MTWAVGRYTMPPPVRAVPEGIRATGRGSFERSVCLSYLAVVERDQHAAEVAAP